ncbi:MAG: hypothetical protein ACTS5I_13780 [Rhodanobacter sp.]
MAFWVLSILFVNFVLGWFFVDYSLMSILGKDIPFYADLLIGMVLGSAAFPVAIVCWVLRLFGVEAPFIGA